jgi:hypothetical protein
MLLACGRRLIKEIDQMEVFASKFAKADIQLKLKELECEEAGIGEKVRQRLGRVECSLSMWRFLGYWVQFNGVVHLMLLVHLMLPKVLLGPSQMKLEAFSRDDGDLDWMLGRARELKIPFEVEILTVLGKASSHRELWLELHPSSPGDSTNEEFIIHANLKGKDRASEKATLEYGGDTSKMKDMLRGSILCRDMNEINSVWKELERLEGQGILKVVVLKNRFRGAPFPGGYRDMNVAVVYQGFVCEIQIHSIEHYKFKQHQHPIYCLCRSYGLVGELPDLVFRPPDSFSATKIHHTTCLPIVLFGLRSIAAIWCCVEFFLYVWSGLCHQYAYTFYMKDIGPVKPWKAVVLAAPYLLVGGMITSDCGLPGICALMVGSIGWGYVVIAEGYVPVDANATVEDYEVPLVTAVFPMVVCVAIYFYARRKMRGPEQARRVSLLYAQYFGMKGSLFAWKVGALQFATVAIQSYTKLSQLGRFATGDDLTTDIYWCFFSLLVFNAVFPPILLLSDNLYLQRVVVSFLDIDMDLLYLLVVPVVLLATHETDHMFIPTDIIGFLSNLLPALHVMTVASAIEKAMQGGWKMANGEDLKPLPWKASACFMFMSLAAMGVTVALDQNAYPFASDVCAPCQCDDGVLVDCSRAEELVRLDLSGRSIRDIRPGNIFSCPFFVLPASNTSPSSANM